MALPISLNNPQNFGGISLNSSNNLTPCVVALGIIGTVSAILAYNLSRKPTQHIHKKEVHLETSTLSQKFINGAINGAGISAGAFIAYETCNIVKKVILFSYNFFFNKGAPVNE